MLNKQNSRRIDIPLNKKKKRKGNKDDSLSESEFSSSDANSKGSQSLKFGQSIHNEEDGD